jgi:hypothetical protein
MTDRFASYVIVEKATGTAVFETANEHVLSHLKTERFEAWPILDWLQEVNRTAKQQESAA